MTETATHQPPARKVALSWRLTEEAAQAIRELARKNGVTQTAILELAIREYRDKRADN